MHLPDDSTFLRPRSSREPCVSDRAKQRHQDAGGIFPANGSSRGRQSVSCPMVYPLFSAVRSSVYRSFCSVGTDLHATKLAQDGLQDSLHPGCAQGHGQGQRSRDTGTFELLFRRH